MASTPYLMSYNDWPLTKARSLRIVGGINTKFPEKKQVVGLGPLDRILSYLMKMLRGIDKPQKLNEIWEELIRKRADIPEVYRQDYVNSKLSNNLELFIKYINLYGIINDEGRDKFRVKYARQMNYVTAPQYKLEYYINNDPVFPDEELLYTQDEIDIIRHFISNNNEGDEGHKIINDPDEAKIRSVVAAHNLGEISDVDVLQEVVREYNGLLGLDSKYTMRITREGIIIPNNSNNPLKIPYHPELNISLLVKGQLSKIFSETQLKQLLDELSTSGTSKIIKELEMEVKSYDELILGLRPGTMGIKANLRCLLDEATICPNDHDLELHLEKTKQMLDSHMKILKIEREIQDVQMKIEIINWYSELLYFERCLSKQNEICKRIVNNYHTNRQLPSEIMEHIGVYNSVADITNQAMEYNPEIGVVSILINGTQKIPLIALGTPSRLHRTSQSVAVLWDRHLSRDSVAQARSAPPSSHYV